MIGGRGFCTGFGHLFICANWTIWPWYSATSFVQTSFIASICSRILMARVSYTVPRSSISSAFHPPGEIAGIVNPNPMMQTRTIASLPRLIRALSSTR
jgi:hypothetical protein